MGDTISPVGELFQHPVGIRARDDVHHRGHRLPGGDAPTPSFLRIGEVTERTRYGARRRGAERVAADAAVGLNGIEPLRLTRRLAYRELAPSRAGRHGRP